MKSSVDFKDVLRYYWQYKSLAYSYHYVKQVYFKFDNPIMQTPIKIPNFCMPLLNVNWYYTKI